MGPNLIELCPCRREIWTETDRYTQGEHHGKMKGETGVMHLHAKEGQRLSAN